MPAPQVRRVSGRADRRGTPGRARGAPVSDHMIHLMTFADLVNLEPLTIDEAVDAIIKDVLEQPELYRGEPDDLIDLGKGPFEKIYGRLRLVVLCDGERVP